MEPLPPPQPDLLRKRSRSAFAIQFIQRSDGRAKHQHTDWNCDQRCGRTTSSHMNGIYAGKVELSRTLKCWSSATRLVEEKTANDQLQMDCWKLLGNPCNLPPDDHLSTVILPQFFVQLLIHTLRYLTCALVVGLFRPLSIHTRREDIFPALMICLHVVVDLVLPATLSHPSTWEGNSSADSDHHRTGLSWTDTKRVCFCHL